jgi:hypothetical protein
MKALLLKTPEYALIVVVLFAGYSPPFSINPIMLLVIAMLVFQIIFKNKVLGIALSFLFMVVNLFFLGALISEFNEFDTFNQSAKELLFVGLTIWVLISTLCMLMLHKYVSPFLQGNRLITLENQEV